MRHFSDKSYRKNQNTLSTFSNYFFFENRNLYEIMWKNIVEAERPEMKIWRVHISLCLPKATNINSEYVILFLFLLQQWYYHEHTSVFS
jgi:hypothetical protein